MSRNNWHAFHFWDIRSWNIQKYKIHPQEHDTSQWSHNMISDVIKQSSRTANAQQKIDVCGYFSKWPYQVFIEFVPIFRYSLSVLIKKKLKYNRLPQNFGCGSKNGANYCEIWRLTWSIIIPNLHTSDLIRVPFIKFL